MNDSSEKRRSFRIVERALVQYDTINDKDFAKGLDRWKIRAGASGIRSKIIDLDSRLDELMYRVQSDAPAACDAIRLLNEKLNVMLEALPEFQETKAALADQPSQVCELSAEGMVFGSNEFLHPDVKLHLRFLLTSDSRYFETFCRVIRTVDGDKSDTASYSHRVAVEFHGMNAAEREVLFQHLFSRQSETLRMRRIQSESDP